MSVINFRKKEIVAKIVYYGPGLSGKTTNVQQIHASMPDETRGELTSLATEQDRTLFFDYVPLHLGNIGGFKTRFQLFTVPGQIYYSDTRRIVLQATDGVVFVADSSPDSMERNRESLQDLQKNLLTYDKLIDAVPFVIQYNKRDLAEALPIPELEAALNPRGVPHLPASAVNGEGVLETLSRISSLVLTHLKTSIEGKLNKGRSPDDMIERFDDEETNDETLVRQLLEQISEVRKDEHAAEMSIVDDDDDDGPHDGIERQQGVQDPLERPPGPAGPLNPLGQVPAIQSNSTGDQAAHPAEDTGPPHPPIPPPPPGVWHANSSPMAPPGVSVPAGVNGLGTPDLSALGEGAGSHSREPLSSSGIPKISSASGPLAAQSAAQSAAQVRTHGVADAHRAFSDGGGSPSHGPPHTPPSPAGASAWPAEKPAPEHVVNRSFSTPAGGSNPGLPVPQVPRGPVHEAIESPPWDGGRTSGQRAGAPMHPPIPLHVHGHLEVQEVGSVQQQGSLVTVPLRVKDSRHNEVRDLVVRFELVDPNTTASPHGSFPGSLTASRFLLPWLGGVSILAAVAFILALF